MEDFMADITQRLNMEASKMKPNSANAASNAEESKATGSTQQQQESPGFFASLKGKKKQTEEEPKMQVSIDE